MLNTQHCIGWAQAKASLWGISPCAAGEGDVVRLSEEAVVRLRYKGVRHIIITDRELILKTFRAAHFVTLRFYFKSGKFFETQIDGVKEIGIQGGPHRVKVTTR
jgi:hypothetical protein